MRIVKTSFVLGQVFGASALLAGCGLINANILDTSIDLQQQVYTQDFGNNSQQVPRSPARTTRASVIRPPAWSRTWASAT